MKWEKSIKIILSILLFLCIAKMPYGYYQFVRIAAMVGFGYLAYSAYKNKKEFLTIIFVLLAVLFQPFEKIALGRTIWNIIDVIVGIGIIFSTIIPLKKKE